MGGRRADQGSYGAALHLAPLAGRGQKRRVAQNFRVKVKFLLPFLAVMDFDGPLSTEVALYKNKQEYDDIVTRGLPLGNDGKEIPSPMPIFGALIPKGAKNIALAKELLAYMIEPKVLNEYLKGGLGRWAVPLPEIAEGDPFWFHEDPHRTAYATETLINPTVSLYQTRRSTPPWRRSTPSMSSALRCSMS